jgi:phycocyanobilin:ferredoxin oxidoreductase
MKYSPVLNQVSDAIYNLLHQHTPVDVKDYGWENRVWTSDLFRWAHLEKYHTAKVSVLHCVIMPHSYTNAPIYGYDVIEINGALTGMFLDVTTVDEQTFSIPRVGEPRPVPDWADFFSDQFVCCKPSPQDIWLGVDVLKQYLQMLPGQPGDYVAHQQKYIYGQRKNPQTFKMLKSHIGEDLAREFMETVLFPDVV